MHETKEERVVRVVKLLTFLTSAKIAKRRNIAIDIRDYEELIEPLPPKHAVVNASTQKIVSVVMNRLSVIEHLKGKYGLQ